MYYEASLADKARKFCRLMAGRRAFPPNDITIEVTTRCGRGCAVCFRGPLGVTPADMAPELYEKVLAGVKAAYRGGGPRYLNFVGLGEPFCHPRLEHYLRLAARVKPPAPPSAKHRPLDAEKGRNHRIGHGRLNNER